MNVTIVGLGGTGSILATPLMKMLVSHDLLESLILVDGDKYSSENIMRQDFMPAFVGENKATYTREKLIRMFPKEADNIVAIPAFLGESELKDVMPEGGAMFLCVDNYYIRKLADEYAKKMSDFLLISGGNGELDGQVQTIHYVGGKNITQETLGSRHEEIDKADPKEDRSKMDCLTLAALPGGGQMVLANMTSATLMLCHFWKAITGKSGELIETFFNCQRVSFRNVVTK